MASDERIVLRLDDSVEFERQLAEAYRKKSRARRQEWIRSVLRAGFAAMSGQPLPPMEGGDSGARAIEVPASLVSSALAHAHTDHQHGAFGQASADVSQIKGLFGDQ